jgi:hypothetical protein
MIHYRNKPKKDKQTPRERSENVPVQKGPIRADHVAPHVAQRDLFDPRSNLHASEALEVYWEEQPYPHSSSKPWCAADPSANQDDNARREELWALTSRRQSATQGSQKIFSESSGNVMKYEYNEEEIELQLRIMVAKMATICQIGDGVDPFVVLPRFQNPELDILLLTRNCKFPWELLHDLSMQPLHWLTDPGMRTFATEITLVKWVPAMLSHPHVMLSSIALASTWLDKLSNISGDSKRTILVKGEIIAMINGRLQHPDTRLADSTLMIILHLLGGEIWSCNEKTLRMHESGMARLIMQRGGMDSFIQAPVAEMCAA